MNIDRKTEIKKNMGLILEKVDNRYFVIYDYTAFEVNEVGARIIELCNGSNNIGTISEKIARYYSRDIDEINSDVEEFLLLLFEKELVRYC